MRTRHNINGSSRASQRIKNIQNAQDKVQETRSSTEKSVGRRRRRAQKSSRKRRQLERLSKMEKIADGPVERSVMDLIQGVPVPLPLDASRNAVFNTVELFEQILSKLPLRDLFVCQRINKHFQHMISKSSRMFLTPSKPGRRTETWKYVAANPHTQYGPWDENCHMRGLKAGEAAPDANGYPTKYTPVRLCPLLRPCWDQYPGRVLNPAVRLARRTGEQAKFNFEFYTYPLQRTSWERMFVSEPAAKAATVELHFIFVRDYPRAGTWQVGSISLKKRVENPEGLRLGDLMRLPADERIEQWRVDDRFYTKLKDPVKVITGMEKRLKAKAIFDPDHWRSSVTLEGMVFPTEEEWRTVK